MNKVSLLFFAICVFGFAHGQNVGIGTTTPTYPLHVVTSAAAAVNVSTSGTATNRQAIVAITSTTGSQAIWGDAKTGSSSAAIIPGQYGVVGTTGNAGTGVGAFATNGNGLTAKSVSGNAIYTEGKLQFSGLGAAVGKVLTSDATGNASWQAMPAGSSAWALSGSNIYNSNSGNVGIGLDGSALTTSDKLQVTNNSGAGAGIRVFANSDAGVWVTNTKTTDGGGAGISCESYAAASLAALKGSTSIGYSATFQNFNTANTSPTAYIYSTGAGHGLQISKPDATGGDGLNIAVKSKEASGIYALNSSTDGGFGIVGESYSGASISGRKQGSAKGPSGLFENKNADNPSPTLQIYSNGTGDKVRILDDASPSDYRSRSLHISSKNVGEAIRIDKTSRSGEGIYVYANTTDGRNVGIVSHGAAGRLSSVGGSYSYGIHAYSGSYDIVPWDLHPAISAGALVSNFDKAGGYGLYARNYASTGAAIYASGSSGTTGAAAGTALELNNGYIKVSGPNKTAYLENVTDANLFMDFSGAAFLTYPNQSDTDIIFVTNVVNPSHGAGNFLGSPVSLLWEEDRWVIFREDGRGILGFSFNVLVIKQ